MDELKAKDVFGLEGTDYMQEQAAQPSASKADGKFLPSDDPYLAVYLAQTDELIHQHER